jgi:hypothetical protein
MLSCLRARVCMCVRMSVCVCVCVHQCTVCARVRALLSVCVCMCVCVCVCLGPMIDALIEIQRGLTVLIVNVKLLYYRGWRGLEWVPNGTLSPIYSTIEPWSKVEKKGCHLGKFWRRLYVSGSRINEGRRWSLYINDSVCTVSMTRSNELPTNYTHNINILVASRHRNPYIVYCF